MSFFPGNDPDIGDAFACDAIETLIIPKVSDIGGFEVRRALPSLKRKLVGPFIFFDRMGPATFRPGEALECGRIRISAFPPSPISMTARSATATSSAPKW